MNVFNNWYYDQGSTMRKVRPESKAESKDDAREVREAYFCNDQGCWVAEEYFCNETGCWIADTPPVAPFDTSAVKGVEGKRAAPEKTIVQQGIFAPAVRLTADVMGRKEL